MKKSPYLLLALFGGASCAGPSAAPGILSGPASANAAQTIREEFNPRSLGEDLLLIQPAFQRPSRDQPAAQPRPDLAPAPEPEISPEPVVEYGPIDVFRLQLVTLSNEAAARQHQGELEQALGVPIYLVTRGKHFMLQAGQYPTRAEAARLKEQVAALGPDYADAYVVSATVETPLSTSVDPTPTSLPEQTETAAEAPLELVRAFGWRVLIDQFLSHDEARRLESKAEKRLRRQDIDVTFKAPWYKIEVGHFRTEGEAQEATEKIASYYPNALKIRSQILVPRED